MTTTNVISLHFLLVLSTIWNYVPAVPRWQSQKQGEDLALCSFCRPCCRGTESAQWTYELGYQTCHTGPGYQILHTGQHSVQLNSNKVHENKVNQSYLWSALWTVMRNVMQYKFQYYSKANLELVMEGLDVVFDSLDQLCLIFTYGTPDVWPHKQRIEAWEDPEHLVGILCSTKLVSQPCCDAGLHPVDSFIISDNQNTYVGIRSAICIKSNEIPRGLSISQYEASSTCSWNEYLNWI